MPTSREKNSNRLAIWLAIIGAAGAIIGGIFAGPLILKWWPGLSPSAEQIAVRVADDSGASISGAKVLLFFEEGAFSQYTDVNGTTLFSNISTTDSIRLIVETEEYEIYEQQIQLPRDKSVGVRLQKRSGGDGGIIFRVVDDTNSTPIAGAKIILLVQGDIYNESTDSNGISKFTLAFPGNGKLDAQMSVSTSSYEINDQTITLLLDRVQDVRLNPSRDTLTIADVIAQPSPTQQTSPTQQPATVLSSIAKNGVVIETAVSTRVDPDTGIRISTESAPSENDNGELRIIIRTPDDKPFVGTYAAVSRQKADLNNQPIRGDRAGDLRTDETGSATISLPPGTYGVYPEIVGYPWKIINFNLEVEADKRTTVIIVPSRFIIVIRRADNSLVTNSYVSISTQKADANGNSLPDQRVIDGRTQDTGAVTFNLTPGIYAIYLEATRGDDWGTLNNELPPATQLTYNVTLGRIRIESRDDKGNVVSGFYSRVAFEKKDANGKTIPGDAIIDGRTDDTGVVNFDLTPGKYLVVSDSGTIEVKVKSGETITVKNSDFIKP